MITINSTTKLTGVFGYPVEHSLSPAMHNAAFSHLKLNYLYLPFLVHPDNLEEAVRSIVALGMEGVNITIPHKQTVIPYLDEISQEAELIEAVNTIKRVDDRLVGYNTDGKGFISSLEEELGVIPKGKSILIVGAGGVARAVAIQSALEGASKVAIANRTEEKAKNLARYIEDNIKGCSTEALSISELKDAILNADILINATPVGMISYPVKRLIETEWLNEDLIVCDLVYNPRQTQLLREAKEKGARTLEGLGMLIFQGSLAFKIWTGREAPLSIMRQTLEKRLGISQLSADQRGV